jgi:hypothetical protein
VHNIQIGTGAAAETVTLGSTNTTSTTTINAGSGHIVLGADTLQRTASGNTTFDLSDTGTTKLLVTNSNSGAGVLSAKTGFEINGGSASAGHYLRGDGTNYVDSTIQAGDLPSLSGTYLRNVPAATSDNTIAPTVNSVVALTVKGTTGTAANVLEVYNSAGSPTRQAYFDSSGSLNVGQLIQPTSSNAIDLGLSGTTFRTGYFGTSVVSPSYTGAGAVTLSSGGANTLGIDTGGAAALSIGATNATTINIGNSALARTVNVATAGGANNQAVNIGTGVTGGSNTSVVTIGSNNAAGSQVILQGGNGTGASAGIQLSTADAGDINVGTTSQTGQLTVGQSTDSNTIAIGNANTANAKTQTITIGNGTEAGTGKAVVTVGNLANASTTTIQGGTSGTAIALTTGSGGSVAITATGTGNLTLTGANGTLNSSGVLNVIGGSAGYQIGGAAASGNYLRGNGTSFVSSAIQYADIPACGGTCNFIGNQTSQQSGANFNVQSASSSSVGGVIKGAASQTADLLDLRDSTGANMQSIAASGNQENLGFFDNGIGGVGQFSNLLTYSEQLDNGAWTASNITVTANDGTNLAPDGQATAEKLAAGASGTHSLAQTCTTGCTTNSATYTFSAWVKADSGNNPTNVQLRIDWNNGGGQTGTAATFSATSTWQRVSVTQAVSASGMVSVTPTLLISTHSATVYGWGAQLVQDSNPEVYNRTTAATQAASAGVVSNGGVFVSSRTNADVPLVVQGTPSQSGDLLQLQNSAASALFKVSAAGAVTAVGVNSGSGLLQGTGGLTVTGATNINATGTSATSLGNSTGVLTVASGGTSGWTNTSGNLTVQTATSGTLALDSAAALTIGGTNATSIGLGNTSTNVLTTINGTALVKPTSSHDSTTAFQVQNAAGGALLTVDSTNTAIVIGKDTSPVAVTVRGGAGSGSNIAGGNITFDASNGTGTQNSGDFIFRTAAGSGSSPTNDSQGNTACTSSVTSCTYTSYTTPATNSTTHILLVGVTVGKGSTGGTSTTSIPTVTYNGTSMTRITGGVGNCDIVTGGSYKQDCLFYMINPPTGAHDIVASINPSATMMVGAETFYNVDQSSPLGNSNFSIGTTSPASTTINTSSSQVVVDSVGLNGQSPTSNASQTNLYTGTNTPYIGASYKAAGASTTTMQWTFTNAEWGEIAVALNPVSNSAADTLSDRLHIAASGNVGIGNATPGANLTVQTPTNNTAAFQVQNAAGAQVLTVDTSSNSAQGQVVLGKASTNMGRLVFDDSGSANTGTIVLGGTLGGSATYNLPTTTGTQTICTSSTSSCNGSGGAGYVVNGTSQQTGNFNLLSAAVGSIAGKLQSATSGTAAVFVAQANTSSTGDLLQLQDSGGNNVDRIDTGGNETSLGYYDNAYGGIGAYGNLLINSEQLDQNGASPAWVRSNLTSVTANDATNLAPDGTASAEKIVSSGSGTHSLAQTCTTGCTTNSATYTFSAWVKADSGNNPTNVQLRVDWNNGGAQTGTASTFSATGTWQRVSVTQAVSASGMVSVTPTLLISSNSVTVYGWGAQLVVASNPGVYVRSTGTQVSASTGVVSNGGMFVSAISASDNPLVIQGALSQSGDLLQFLPYNTTTTPLAKIDANGNLYVNGSTTTGIDTVSGAGTIALGSANASNINIGTNAAAHTIAVGSGNASNGITIGSNQNTGSTLTLDAGTGANSIAIGNTASVHQISIGAGGGANNQTIALGSGVTGGSNTSVVTIGSNNGAASTLLLQGGNGTGASAAIKLSTADAGDINIGTTTQTGQITVGQADSTNTISIGTVNRTAHTQTVTIGGGTSATSGGVALNLATGTPGSSTADTVHIADGGTTTGTDNVTIGSNGAAAHTLILQGGNGTGASAAIRLNTAAAGDINIGATTHTGAIQVGQSTSGETVNVGNGANASGTNTVAIGSGATSSGVDAVTLGSTNSTSTTTIQGGTGSGAIALSSGVGGVISVASAANGSGTSGNITLTTGTSSSGNASIIAKSGTNSTAAFQVQGASGSGLLTVDSTNDIVSTNALNVGASSAVGSAGRLFSDGFETGDAGAWTGTGGSGTLSYDTATVRNGKYSFKSADTNTHGGYAQISYAGNTTVYGRTYFNATTAGNPTPLIDFGTGAIGSGNHLYLDLEASGNLCYHQTLNGSSTACSATAPSTSAWHKLEAEVVISASVGVLQVWLDGTLVTTNSNAINLSSQNFGSTALTNFAVGGSDTVATATSTTYFDDAAVDTVATGDVASLGVADSLHVSGTSSFENEVRIAASSVPSTDQLLVTNSGQAPTAANANGVHVNYTGGSAAVEGSGIRVDFTPGGTTGGTWNGLRIATSTKPASGVTAYGISLVGPGTSASGTEAAINIDSGWDIGIAIANGGIKMSGQTTPSAPSSSGLTAASSTGSVAIYAQNIAGKMFLKTLGPFGTSLPVQDALFAANVCVISHQNNTFNAQGCAASAALGNATSGRADQTCGATTDSTSLNSTNSEAGTATSTATFFRGSTAGANGFFFEASICLPDASYSSGSGTRMFVGMSSATTTTQNGNDNPAGNFAGFQYSTPRGDTKFEFITKDGTTESAAVDTITLTAGDAYQLYIYTPPQGSTIYYRIDDLTAATSATGTTTSNLPTSSTAMRAMAALQTQDATARTISIQHVYTEVDR